MHVKSIAESSPLLQNAPAILSTFIKLPLSINTCTYGLSIFKWPLKTDFSVYALIDRIKCTYTTHTYILTHAEFC